METNNKEPAFTVNAHSRTYYVEPVGNDDHCTRFKISTECEYMFTLCIEKYGNWSMEGDVIPINETLVDDISIAIEQYDAH